MKISDHSSKLEDVNDTFNLLRRNFPEIIQEFHNLVGQMYNLDAKRASEMLKAFHAEVEAGMKEE